MRKRGYVLEVTRCGDDELRDGEGIVGVFHKNQFLRAKTRLPLPLLISLPEAYFLLCSPLFGSKASTEFEIKSS